MILSRWPSLSKLFRFLPERQVAYLDLNLWDISLQKDILSFSLTCMLYGDLAVGDVGAVEIHDSGVTATD